MSQQVRWLIALSVTVAAVTIGIWVSGAYLLPMWVKSGSDRWVIASGIGVALAAFAALWGVDFARNENNNNKAPGNNSEKSSLGQIHMKAKAEGSGRIYQAGGDQKINDR